MAKGKYMIDLVIDDFIKIKPCTYFLNYNKQNKTDHDLRRTKQKPIG